MKFKKIAALLLTASVLVASLAGCSSNTSSNNSVNESSSGEQSTDPAIGDPVYTNVPEGYGLTDNIKDGAILHCFAWSFKTITESMEDIASAGFSTIQTSPVNLCYDGGDGGMDLFGSGKWFYHYQPVDWTIGNYQLGTKDEFITMCQTAEEYGIKVIVDVVPNHTTKNEDAISQTFLDAVGGMSKLYHTNGKETISNYSDRAQCTLWAMAGLYDVNTENPDFQNYFIKFLNDCIACGVDGFRYDTAKHIGLPDDPQDDPSLPNNFWERVTTEIDNADTIFNYGEVLQGDGERISDYIDIIGATTASTYGSNIRSAIITKNLSASKVSDLCVGGKTDVVTWVESHDNYTEDGGTSSNITNDHIIIGWSIIAARGKGTPLFFSRPYGANKENVWGTFNKIGMAGDNLYKDPTIVAVNRFRNAMVGESENMFNVDGYNAALFIERGERGLVIINSASSDYEFTTKTALKDGTYINRVDNTTAYVVKNGEISGKVPAGSVVVLCNDGYADVPVAAVVKVADDTNSNIIGDSKEVTLVAENTATSVYSINGGNEIAFTNGDTVTIGADLKPLETVTLTLKGTNKEGKGTCITYIFKKLDAIPAGTRISFVKPDSWKSKISAYVYDETTYSTVKENSGWPGEEMTDNGLTDHFEIGESE
ncbi:MAG: alpha-amylase family glycosyl hydrolase, partial [Butyrivibrio sp.]